MAADKLARSAAGLASLWFRQAGSLIAAPVTATHVAALDGAKQGLLAAAIDLRSLLSESVEGRQALADLGFLPVLQNVEGGGATCAP